MPKSYRPNSPQIAHQTLDGEVVIVNLASGKYYSLRGSAVFLWSLLEQGCSEEAICQCFLGPASEVAPILQRFYAELVAEDILHSFESADRIPVPVSSNQAVEQIALEPPVLEKFTDMQELLLLDPIHEVTDAGWPHAA